MNATTGVPAEQLPTMVHHCEARVAHGMERHRALDVRDGGRLRCPSTLAKHDRGPEFARDRWRSRPRLRVKSTIVATVAARHPFGTNPNADSSKLSGNKAAVASSMPAGAQALLLGANGIEVDEPRLEQRLRDGFEGGVGFAQEGDAVVECVQHCSDRPLHRSMAEPSARSSECHGTAGCRTTAPTLMNVATDPASQGLHEVTEKRRCPDGCAVRPQHD